MSKLLPASERTWVKSIAERLEESLKTLGKDYGYLRIKTGYRLPYAFEVLNYNDQESQRPNISRYQTDLLIYEDTDKNSWVPRVVIECKLAKVSTHDALTYSTKAFTHKHVHPYLRYGILIGKRQNRAVPGRVFRHGAFFDFMVTWVNARASKDEWKSWLNLIRDEIEASRITEKLLTTNRKKNRKRPALIHRHLIVK